MLLFACSCLSLLSYQTCIILNSAPHRVLRRTHSHSNAITADNAPLLGHLVLLLPNERDRDKAYLVLNVLRTLAHDRAASVIYGKRVGKVGRI